MQIRVDCDIPRKISCDCCTCSGAFTMHEDVLTCSSSTLTIALHNNAGESFEIELMEADEIIIQDNQYSATTANKNYTTCISATGCHDLTISSDETEVKIDSNIM